MTQYPQQQPGYQTPGPGAGGTVPNYLVQSIISIFCCLPLGVVAVIFAAQVNGKLQSGDYAGAVDASKKAKLFSTISIGIGLVWLLINIIMMVAGMSLPWMAGNNP